jgi:formylglycine-generating enzyme required for sulfatase activity
MVRARLLAIPVLVVLAGASACDNPIVVARNTATGSEGGSSGGGGGSSGGSSSGSDDASSSGPGDSASNEDAHPIEGTGGDAMTGDGGGQEAASPEAGAGDTGTSIAPDGGGGDATASSDAGDAGTAGDSSAAGDGGDGSQGDSGASDAGDAATDGGSAEGGPTHGPSCIGLAANCGPHHDEDCCAARTVPGGTFNRDNNASYPATVDTFVLDRFEVTVGRFRKFYAQYPGNQPAGGAGKNTNVSVDPGWDAKWNMSTYTASTASALDSNIRNTNTPGIWIDWTLGDDTLPMNCIDWYEAYEFCIWDGGRLPTELEWNYAAAGGSDQRPYPWSTSPTDTTNDYTYAVYDSPTNAATVYDEVGSCSPKGDAKWGHADMAGNVMEWVEDWSTGGYPATCVDCANVPWNDTIISPSPYRQTRGGSAADYPSQITTYTRWYYNQPSFRIDNIGVRCARNP